MGVGFTRFFFFPPITTAGTGTSSKSSFALVDFFFFDFDFFPPEDVDDVSDLLVEINITPPMKVTATKISTRVVVDNVIVTISIQAELIKGRKGGKID